MNAAAVKTHGSVEDVETQGLDVFLYAVCQQVLLTLQNEQALLKVKIAHLIDWLVEAPMQKPVGMDNESFKQ